jgi:hypothetical protein
VLELKALPGQSAVLPVHVSGGSQMPADTLHTSVLELEALPGQAAVLPVHVYGGSQMPADTLHTSVLELKALTGQLALLPVHFSGGSHMPADALHSCSGSTRTQGGSRLTSYIVPWLLFFIVGAHVGKCLAGNFITAGKQKRKKGCWHCSNLEATSPS